MWASLQHDFGAMTSCVGTRMTAGCDEPNFEQCQQNQQKKFCSIQQKDSQR